LNDEVKPLFFDTIFFAIDDDFRKPRVDRRRTRAFEAFRGFGLGGEPAAWAGPLGLARRTGRDRLAGAPDRIWHNGPARPELSPARPVFHPRRRRPGITPRNGNDA